jgi:hypothetical protein
MHKFYTVVIFIFLSINSFAQQIPTNGLIAWYPFCGNSNDMSGNGHNLINSNAVLATDRFGNLNNAYQFNGTNSILYMNSMFNLPGDFTYSCWAQADTDLNAMIIYLGYSGSNGYGIIESDAPVYSIGHNFTVLFGNVNHMATYTIAKHQWHHAVIRQTGSFMDFYLDTVHIGTITAAFQAPCCEFTVGADTFKTGHVFMGRIDDIAVYNRSLSLSEITELFVAGNNCTLSVNEIPSNLEDFKIYPNPNNGLFCIEANLNGNEAVKVKIINPLGQIIFKQDFISNTSLFKQYIQLPAISSGLYFVSVETSQSKIVKPVSIKL